MRYKLLAGQHQEGKIGAVKKYKVGDIITTDKNLVTLFNQARSKKFELVDSTPLKVKELVDSTPVKAREPAKV